MAPAGADIFRQAQALQMKLKNADSGRIRTCNLLIRSQLLYPVELLVSTTAHQNPLSLSQRKTFKAL